MEKTYYEMNKEAIKEYSEWYREKNKEKIALYKKQYRLDNPEKILKQEEAKRAKYREKIVCKCGCIISKKCMPKHKKSKKHIDLMSGKTSLP